MENSCTVHRKCSETAYVKIENQTQSRKNVKLVSATIRMFSDDIEVVVQCFVCIFVWLN